MANSLYTNYKNLMLGGGTHSLPTINSATALKVHLLDAADHTTNLATNIDEADITNAAIVATGTLTSVTATNGVVDAADEVLSSVTGDATEELVLWFDTTTDSTSPLLVNFDTSVSVTPNGGDITIQWNASGIFTL